MSYTEEQELIALCTKVLMVFYRGFVAIQPHRRSGIFLTGTTYGHWEGDVLSLLKAVLYFCKTDSEFKYWGHHSVAIREEIANLVAASSYSLILEQMESVPVYDEYTDEVMDPHGFVQNYRMFISPNCDLETIGDLSEHWVLVPEIDGTYVCYDLRTREYHFLYYRGQYVDKDFSVFYLKLVTHFPHEFFSEKAIKPKPGSVEEELLALCTKALRFQLFAVLEREGNGFVIKGNVQGNWSKCLLFLLKALMYYRKKHLFGGIEDIVRGSSYSYLLQQLNETDVRTEEDLYGFKAAYEHYERSSIKQTTRFAEMWSRYPVKHGGNQLRYDLRTQNAYIEKYQWRPGKADEHTFYMAIKKLPHEYIEAL